MRKIIKYQLNPGDLPIARVADPGHGVLIEEKYDEEKYDAVFASYLIRFIPRETRYGRYLQYWQKYSFYLELNRSKKNWHYKIKPQCKNVVRIPYHYTTSLHHQKPLLKGFPLRIGTLNK